MLRGAAPSVIGDKHHNTRARRAFSMRRRTSAISPMLEKSTLTLSTLPLAPAAASHSACTACSSAVRRPVTQTIVPRAAYRNAIVRPIPVGAPTTRTRLDASSMTCVRRLRWSLRTTRAGIMAHSAMIEAEDHDIFVDVVVRSENWAMSTSTVVS